MSRSSLLVFLVAAVPGLSGWLDAARAERVIAVPAVDVQAAGDTQRVEEPRAETRAAATVQSPARAQRTAVLRIDTQDAAAPHGRPPCVRRVSWRSAAPARGPPVPAPVV